jgi:hypothetical protein
VTKGTDKYICIRVTKANEMQFFSNLFDKVLYVLRTGPLSETCKSALSNKFEKQCISLAFIIRIYHDARSSDCEIFILARLKTN